MTLTVWKLLLASVAIVSAATAQAEVGEVKLMSQYGIGYMQLTVMKGDKLVEKHLAKAGMSETKVSWTTLGAGAAPTMPCSRGACTSRPAAPAPRSSCGTGRATTSTCAASPRCPPCRTCS